MTTDSDRRLPPFELEQYFAIHEFTAKTLIGCSDAESTKMTELVAMADTECSNLWETVTLGYTETKGLPLLNKEIAKTYDLRAEHVLCFAGAAEGIYATMRAMLTPEDHVIAVTPCYQSLKSVAESFCSVSLVDLLRLDDSWALQIELIENAIRPNTKIIVINFPHNPTGSVIKLASLQALVDVARKHSIWIFSDEVYRGIESDLDDLLPQVATIYEKGISLGVMSKAYGLAGIRVGWIVCTDLLLLHTINNVKHYLSICNSVPSEILAVIALRNSTTILERNRQITMENSILFENFLDNWRCVFSWVKPKGGCCAFPRYLLKGEDKMTLKELSDTLIKDYGILIIPGSMFPTRSLDVSDHFRLGLGRKDFAESLDALQAALLKILC